MRRSWFPLCRAFCLVAVPGDADAQGRGRAGGGPPPTGRAAAPKDLTGTWVSVVTEHWHLRMIVPPKGEFAMLPLNPEARKLAGAWDPAKEPAAEACRSYGAAAIMRVPGRFHIQWVDDNTLQMDIDSGTQTRVFRFGGAAAGDPGARVAGLLGRELGGAGRARPRRHADAAEGQSPPGCGRGTCARTACPTARTRRSRNTYDDSPNRTATTGWS